MGMKSLRIYLDHKNAQICDKWIPFTVSKIDIITKQKNLKENHCSNNFLKYRFNVYL